MEPAPLLDLSTTAVSAIRRIGFGVAVLAVVLSLVGHWLGWLDFKPGGTAFDVDIRPIFTAFFAVSILLALKWEILGGVLAAFAGAALITFATRQLITGHAIVVIALLLIPAACWLLIDLAELRPGRAIAGIVAMFVMAGAGLAVGQLVYENFWGPTHPESAVKPLPASGIEWVWSGAVSTNGGEVRARPSGDYDNARLAISTSADLTEARFVDASDGAGRVVGFEIADLDPNTLYHYAVEIDGELDTVRTGTFQTFPEGAASYTMAIGSCARVGSNGQVFDAIRDIDPLFYLIAGDLHYGDNGRNEIERFQEVMDLTLALPAQAALYQQTSIAYVWDDHDYGANDADGNSASRQAAMSAYREYVPSHELSSDESAVYQAFTAGRVRYILTDARAARNLDNDDNSDAPSMLGFEQKQWFKDEILSASLSHELVVWLNPVPWIAPAEDGADHWGGYAIERRELADHIATNDINNMIMIGGDAHMVAIDNGTNTDYSSSGYPGFPLIHSAALDRPGSVKGGPYSEGAIGSGGQFATLEISDNGDTITVNMRALNWKGEELMSLAFTTP